ncbi:MAG TPA: phosphatase PAP2 family protein, partial [Actinobacteria bacterium]|nr:phosphatase PAP2 family protein [Actinomycetes bacterium]HEX21684.1 phosphatase PAP2 family protein [Actinomycetota bacterium]
YVLRTQRNMKVHFIVAAAVLGISLILNVSGTQFMLLLIVIAMVLVSELINTAIESAVDITTSAYDPLAKVAKDVAAASVMVSVFAAVVVGYLIFYPRLNSLTFRTLHRVRQSPLNVTAISLFIVLIAVFAAKAWTRSGTWLRGGWPSGHSALAGALFTAIALISRQALLATLAFIMALLVFQSRKEARFHSYLEILSGAAIGILITLLIFQLFLW